MPGPRAEKPSATPPRPEGSAEESEETAEREHRPEEPGFQTHWDLLAKTSGHRPITRRRTCRISQSRDDDSIGQDSGGVSNLTLRQSRPGLTELDSILPTVYGAQDTSGEGRRQAAMLDNSSWSRCIGTVSNLVALARLRVLPSLGAAMAEMIRAHDIEEVRLARPNILGLSRKKRLTCCSNLILLWRFRPMGADISQGGPQRATRKGEGEWR